MVGGGQQAPCQALSHTAVLAKMGVGAASAQSVYYRRYRHLPIIEYKWRCGNRYSLCRILHSYLYDNCPPCDLESLKTAEINPPNPIQIRIRTETLVPNKEKFAAISSGY